MEYVSEKEIKNINKEIGEGGIELLPTLSNIVYSEKETNNIIDASVILLCNIVKFHPFINGNKRTAFYSFILLLRKNGYVLKKDYNFNDKMNRILVHISTGKAKKHQVSRLINKMVVK